PASVAGVVTAALVASVALAACGPGTTITATVGTVGGPQVVAEHLAFEPTTIQVPAGEAFSLELVNRDSAPHNVSIYRDASASQQPFGGDVVSGPGSVVYDVPALPAGTWFFRCDVHPDMRGTIVATSPAGS